MEKKVCYVDYDPPDRIVVEYDDGVYVLEWNAVTQSYSRAWLDKKTLRRILQGATE